MAETGQTCQAPKAFRIMENRGMRSGVQLIQFINQRIQILPF